MRAKRELNALDPRVKNAVDTEEPVTTTTNKKSKRKKADKDAVSTSETDTAASGDPKDETPKKRQRHKTLTDKVYDVEDKDDYALLPQEGGDIQEGSRSRVKTIASPPAPKTMSGPGDTPSKKEKEPKDLGTAKTQITEETKAKKKADAIDKKTPTIVDAGANNTNDTTTGQTIGPNVGNTVVDPGYDDRDPQSPKSFLDVAKIADHQLNSKTISENILSHINSGNLSDAERAKLHPLLVSLGKHVDLETVPTKDQEDELKDIAKIAGNFGKKPAPEPEPDPGPQPPSSDMEQAVLDDHTSTAEQLLSTITSHLESGELDDDETEKLQRLADLLDSHVSLSTVPTKEQVKELKEIQRLAGEHGKSPFEEEEYAEDEEETQEPETKPKKGKKTNLMSAYKRGEVAGEVAGKAAMHGSTAGTLGGQVVRYGSQGTVSAGHSLLTGEEKKEEELRTKTNKHGEQTAQSSLKSLYLDLDISKAVTLTNVGSVAADDRREKVRHIASYAKNPTGVTGDQYTPDDPEVGKQWRENDEDSVSAEVDDMLSAEEDEDNKAEKSLSIIASVQKSAENELRRSLPTNLEEEFLVEVMGYNREQVSKGLAVISGRHRHEFNMWAHERLTKSLSCLLGVVR